MAATDEGPNDLLQALMIDPVEWRDLLYIRGLKDRSPFYNFKINNKGVIKDRQQNKCDIIDDGKRLYVLVKRSKIYLDAAILFSWEGVPSRWEKIKYYSNEYYCRHNRYRSSNAMRAVVHKDKDYTAKKGKYTSALTKLQNIYRLKDSDELSIWHQHFWLEYILNGAKSSDFANIPDNILYPLMKRWAFSDKSYKMTEINKLKSEHPKFVDWVRSTEKLDHAKMLKNNMQPFEQIFFGVGAEILANASNFLSVSPEKTAKKLVDDLNKASKSLMAKKDFSNIDKLRTQLAKLKSMPNISKAAPTEGVVFKYNGKVFKFTGFFAPINQILGLEKFSR